MRKILLLFLLTGIAFAQTEAGGTSAAGGRGSLTLTILGPALSISPSAIDFGQVTANTSASNSVTLSNPGNATLSSLALGTVSPPYSLTSTCSTSLASGASCTLTFTFHPTLAGSFPASLTISSVAGTNFVALNGSATGTASASVSPSSLVFGQQTVGTTSQAQNITYSNTGSSTLTLSSVSSTGPFNVNTSACAPPVDLAPGTGCSVSVRYSPQAVQSDTGTVTFTDNSATSPETVSLSGIGVASNNAGASISASPSGRYLEFETTSALQGSSTAIAEVQNVNTFCGTSGTSCSGTVNNVTAGNALIVTVRWTPQSVTLSVPGFTCASTQLKPGVHVMAMCYAFNVGGGNTTVTASFSAAASTSSISVTEFSGVSGLDNAVVGGSLGSVSSLASPSLSPSQPNDLLYGFCYTGTATASADPAFVGLWGGNVMPEYRIINATGSYNVTCTASAASNLGVLLGSFKGSGTSVSANSPFSSLAELNAIDNNGASISQAGWTATCDSADTTNPCADAIDGNNGDFWQSQTQGSTPPQPHHVIVDLGSTKTISAITTLVRQDGCSNGWPSDYNVYLDNVNPPLDKITSGTFSYTGFLFGCPGAGTPPAFNIGLTNASGNFGAVNVGTTSAPQTFFLLSNGTSALSISSITANGDYAQTNDCPASLAVGDECSINVTFTPTTTGTRTGTINIADNAPNSPQTISLTGTGQSTAKTLQSVSVGGPSSIVVSSTGQFTAICHYSDGSASSCTASWALSNNTATGTTVNASTGLVTAGATVGTATITATNSSISGAMGFSVISASSMMPNVCTSPSGMVDCSSGSAVAVSSLGDGGWNVLCTLSFESGTNSGTTPGKCDTGAKQGTGGNTGGATSTTLPHTGSQAFRVHYAGPTGTFLYVSDVSTSHEVYMSFWTHQDFFTDNIGNFYGGFDFNWAAFKNAAGTKDIGLEICCANAKGNLSPGGFGGSQGSLQWASNFTGNAPWRVFNNAFFAEFDGAWHHWEIHYKANTCNPCGTTGGTANLDGVLQLWVDGSLVNQFGSANLNGWIDMSGMSVQTSSRSEPGLWLQNASSQTTCNSLWNAGGPYTCKTSVNDPGFGCDTSAIQGARTTGLPVTYANLNAACGSPPQSPGNAWDRYVDDVVVLYR